MPSDLLDAHQALHDRLLEDLWRTLEALTTLDVDKARATVDAFAALLRHHMDAEDARVMPRYRALAPAEGPGRADHVDGDHVILLRNLDGVLEAMDALGPTPTLRDVLRMLPAAYRLLGTLEHHTLREQTHVYPAVERASSPEERRALFAELSGLVEGAQLS